MIAERILGPYFVVAYGTLHNAVSFQRQGQMKQLGASIEARENIQNTRIKRLTPQIGRRGVADVRWFA